MFTSKTITGYLLTINFILYALFTSCATKEDNKHPVEENIPFLNSTHLEITIDSHNYEHLAERYKHLSKTLQNLSSYDFSTIPIQTKYFNTTLIDEVSPQELLIGEKSQSIVCIVNETDSRITVDTLARQGNGPFEIQLPGGISADKKYIYVYGSYRRIDRFKSKKSGWTKDKSFPIPVHLNAFDHSDSLIAATSVPAIRKESTADEFATTDPVTIFDTGNLNKLLSFGHSYDFGNDYMLIMNMVQKNSIALSGRGNSIFLAYNALPIIYRYTATGQLKQTYRISTFEQGYFTYNRNTNSVTNPTNRNHSIHAIRFLDNRHLLIHLIKLFPNPGAEITNEYFLIDINNNQSFYIGEVASVGTVVEIFPNFIVQNGEGSVSMLKW
jgi:hypothetical protein